MAWKYPKRPIKGTYVIDIDAINQNLLTVAEENSGYLNEHNFKGPGISGTGVPNQHRSEAQLVAVRDQTKTNSLAEGIGFRLHVTRADNVSPVNTDATNWTMYRPSDFYVTKAKSGFSMTREFVGSLVWISASFTLHNHHIPAQTANDENIGEKGFGFNAALELDGAIIPESLVGTGDITQEEFGNKAHASKGTGNGIKCEPRGGGGLNGARNAVVLDAVVYIPPGQHTIRVAIQSIRNSGDGLTDGYDCDTAISTCEMFALEMIR
jgi:hypothetical protein